MTPDPMATIAENLEEMQSYLAPEDYGDLSICAQNIIDACGEIKPIDMAGENDLKHICDACDDLIGFMPNSPGKLLDFIQITATDLQKHIKAS